MTKGQKDGEFQPAPSTLRNLRALGCPLRASLRSPEFESVILFLEEAFVRCLPQRKRAEFLQGDSSASWSRVLKYCEEAGVPLDAAECIDTPENRRRVLGALVCLAVSLSYEDRCEGKEIRTPDSWAEPEERRIFNSSEKAVPKEALRLYTQVAPCVSRVLCALDLPPLPENPSPEEVDAALETAVVRVSETDAPINAEATQLLSALPVAVGGLGRTETKDGKAKTASDAAWRAWQKRYVAVARLFHIERLQQVQEKVTRVLESLQLLTANPKTDRTLAKVGY